MENVPSAKPTCRRWREVRFLPVAVSAAAPHHVSYSCDNSEADDIFFLPNISVDGTHYIVNMT